MKILFGTYLDGVVWSYEDASIGSIRTGPMGMLNVLENILGTSVREINRAGRINEYMKRMESMDSTDMWYHDSFSADPWSTAGKMLEIRDALIGAGWDGRKRNAVSPKLKDIELLEQSEIELSPGLSDRLRTVLEELGKRKSLPVSSILLSEPLSVLPPVWQKIMGELSDLGVNVDETSLNRQTEFRTGCNILQKCVQDIKEDISDSSNGDSIVLLKARNEWEAAEHLALWLSAQPDKNDTVTIVCGTDTDVLDKALEKHSLPTLGRSSPSRWREMHQVIPLMLANAWRPVDIYLLAQFLSLSSAPFPKWVCRKLLRAISEEPGVGGEAWGKALEDIAQTRERSLLEKKDDRAREKSEELVSEIRDLLEKERYDPVTGIPEENLKKRCRKITQWMGKLAAEDDAAREVVSAAKELESLSDGKGNIPKVLLERMLDSVTGPGSDSKDNYEQAAVWKTVDHPGQISDKCKTLVWWGFNDTSIKEHLHWSKSEREYLEKLDVFIEKPEKSRIRESYSWRSALGYVSESFIGIYINRIDGEESYRHPLWDEIQCDLNKEICNLSHEKILSRIVKDCKSFCNGTKTLAGRRHRMIPLEKEPFEPPSPLINVGPSLIPFKRRMSYSQMGTLIECPMKWVLEYRCNLRVPEIQDIPEGNRMIGSLCHRIVEELYKNLPGRIDPGQAKAKAESLYDKFIPSMASVLLLEGNSTEKLRYKTAVSDAVKNLVQSVNRLGLQVEKTEAKIEGKIRETEFVGYADLLLRDDDRNLYLLDMKWTSSDKYHQKEIEEGNALQLATYAGLLKGIYPSREIYAGYFMLAQGRILSDSIKLGDHRIESPVKLEDTWAMGLKTMENVMDKLRSGYIEVTGVKEEILQKENELNIEKVREIIAHEYLERDMIYRSPPCRFCDQKSLCGYSGESK